MGKTPFSNEFEIDRALGRGMIYEVLALALRPPTAESLSRLTGSEAREALLDAAAVLDDGSVMGQREVPGRGESSFRVTPALERLLLAAGDSTLDSLGISYQRLFGHTARGQVPPYETEYGPNEVFRRTQELADLSGFYRAFGLTLASARHERSDHISVECEFLFFLACKEARELIEGDFASSEAVRDAERLFLRDHTGRFGRAFARSLGGKAGNAFYRAAADLCSEFLSMECEAAGIPLGPELVPLRPSEEPEVPMACGGCELASLPNPGEPTLRASGEKG